MIILSDYRWRGPIVCGIQALLLWSGDMVRSQPPAYSPTLVSQVPRQQITPVAAEPRIALVIGNSAYGSKGQLKNPKNDATQIQQSLQRLGFRVIPVLDANKKAMDDALKSFARELQSQKGGLALVFYAGHGLQSNGENYLVPIGAQIKQEKEIPAQAIGLSQIFKAVEDNTGKRKTIVLLDACRDTPFGNVAGKGLATPSRFPQDTFLSFATRPGEVASDGTGEHSPYTSGLLKYLEVKNTPLLTIFENVRQAVQEETKGLQVTYDSSTLSEKVFLNANVDLTSLPLGLTGEQGSAGSRIKTNAGKDTFTITAAPRTLIPNEPKVIYNYGFRQSGAVVKVKFNGRNKEQRATFGFRRLLVDPKGVITEIKMIRISILGGNPGFDGRTIEVSAQTEGTPKQVILGDQILEPAAYSLVRHSDALVVYLGISSDFRGHISVSYSSPSMMSGWKTVFTDTSPFLNKPRPGMRSEIFMSTSSDDSNRETEAEFSELSIFKDGG
jgi:Caspase domain